jgi:hypothetical protein
MDNYESRIANIVNHHACFVESRASVLKLKLLCAIGDKPVYIHMYIRVFKIKQTERVICINLQLVKQHTCYFTFTGVQFIKDCPMEPYIPVYMLIGGVLGAVRIFWALYSQIRSRRPEVLSVPAARSHISPMKLLSIALSCFLVVWFALGKRQVARNRRCFPRAALLELFEP